MKRLFRGANPHYGGPRSDHFDGRLFFNPGGNAPRGFADLMRWQFGGGKAVWPAHAPSPFPRAKPDARVTGSALRLTMVGHSTLLLQVSGLNILTDPVWSQRASPFAFAGPKRVNPPGISFDDLPPIDLVLVSHNHYDHLDRATLRRLSRRHRPRVLTPLGNDGIIARGVAGSRVTAHDWEDVVDVGEGVKVHIEPVHHWSARGTRDRRMALWSGFTLETPAGKIFFAGDTGFQDGFAYRRLAQKHGRLRLAILPIGAYEPRWFMEALHQNPDEAVRGMLLAGADFAAGCHWGTFQLTNEPIDEPRTLLGQALARHGVAPARFPAMMPGEVWDVPESTADRPGP